MSNVDWASLLPTIAAMSPLMIVYVTGIVLALCFIKKHPAVSVLCLIAFLMLLGNLTILLGTIAWQLHALNQGVSTEQLSNVMQIGSVIRTVIGTIAWALLLIAMFGWRSNRLPPIPPEKTI